MSTETAAALGDRLAVALRGIDGPIAIAVSGGIDSLTLATVAQDARSGVAMFHAISPAVPGEATARVERIAAERAWDLRVIEAGEFDDPKYRANPTNRCFFCKTNLYGAIARHSRAQMLSGANMNDLGEYRPGLEAAQEFGVRHPYLEVGIDKATVRALARHHGLGALSQLPSAPCLSSRVETGIAIRPDVLHAIHAVERGLAHAFPRATVRCRVRASGIVVELDPDTLSGLDVDRRAEVARAVTQHFGPLMPEAALSFAPYRNGSAFLHRPR